MTRRSASTLPKRDARVGEAVMMLRARIENIGSITDWSAERLAHVYHLHFPTAERTISEALSWGWGNGLLGDERKRRERVG